MSILINSFSLQNRGLACKSPLGTIPGMFRPQTMSRNCLGVLAGKDLKRAWEPRTGNCIDNCIPVLGIVPGHCLPY